MLKSKLFGFLNLMILSGFFVVIYITVSGSFSDIKSDLKSINSNSDFIKCGTDIFVKDLMEKDPDYARRLLETEENIKRFLESHKDVTTGLVTIPVVFHVIYNTPNQNVPEDLIREQLRVMNEDFLRMNSDTTNTPAPFKPLGSNTQISFVLAQRDPFNNPTLGITRTQTSVTAFNGDEVKSNASGGHDPWPNNNYLNVWLCNLGGGLLGYAYYPGAPPSIDGVVILYNTVPGGPGGGPYNGGRTLTHEVGHYLSLRHIWGDSFCGNDLVDDTPVQQEENYGCPAFPRRPNSCGTSNANGDMFMNYMDYTNDDCMNIFTHGQSDRMNVIMQGIRFPLTVSNGGTPVSGVPIASFTGNNTTVNFGESTGFTDLSAGIPTSWNWTFEGGTPSTSNQQNPSNIVYNTPGFYTVRLTVSNSFGTDSVTKTGYIKVLGAPMSSFTQVSPPQLSSIMVTSEDTSSVDFVWTRSGSHPSINYKFKIRKQLGATIEYVYNSNNSGSDSVLSLRKNLLDSLAGVFGTVDDTVRANWRIVAYNGVDSLATGNFIFTIKRGTIGINSVSTSIPDRFYLDNNYPNPFNPATKIRFDVSKFDKVNITIFDMLGRKIEVLVNEHIQPGKYEVEFNALNLSSGIYYYRMETSDFVNTKKMLLIK